MADYEDDSDEFSATFLGSIGGRYFLNKQNISPYVGGGFSIINISYESKAERPVMKTSHHLPVTIGGIIMIGSTMTIQIPAWVPMALLD